jgi:NADH-quinone oxidoreductase subunit J
VTLTTDLVVFLVLAAVGVASAVTMIASPNAIYSALFLVVNFFTVAVLYLLLEASFLSMIQVTVYAGAIMVLFLFVIMLLGAERVEEHPSLPFLPPLAVGMGFVLVVALVYAVLRGQGLEGVPQSLSEGFGSPRQVGELLFRDYLVPFEVTSILLLVAMVGAIVLTRDDRKRDR